VPLKNHGIDNVHRREGPGEVGAGEPFNGRRELKKNEEQGTRLAREGRGSARSVLGKRFAPLRCRSGWERGWLGVRRELEKVRVHSRERTETSNHQKKTRRGGVRGWGRGDSGTLRHEAGGGDSGNALRQWREKQKVASIRNCKK